MGFQVTPGDASPGSFSCARVWKSSGTPVTTRHSSRVKGVNSSIRLARAREVT